MSDSVTPSTAACQASLSLTVSPSLLKLMSIESVMPSSHLTFYHPLLLLPSIFPSLRWILRLSPCLGCCEWCCSEHRSADTHSRSSFLRGSKDPLSLTWKWDYCWTIPTRNVNSQVSPFSTFLPTVVITCLFIFLIKTILKGMRWCLTVVLIYISLMISGVEHLCMYLLTIFFGKISIQDLCSFKNQIISLFPVELCELLVFFLY